MEQTLTAKALAHLPSYMPLQSFFFDQYYSNQSYPANSQKGNNSTAASQGNSNHSYPSQSHSLSQQLPHLAAGNSSLLSSGYSENRNNSTSTSSSSSIQQNSQFPSIHHGNHSSHHSHQQSHHSLQQLASQLQSSSSSSQQAQQHQMLMMEMLSTSESSEEGSQQNALQQLAHCQQLNQLKKMEQKYKTELCKNWVSKGVCQYGQKCRFAHGKEELIERLAMNKNYKTKLCTAYHKERICQYAARCHFKHDERTANEIRYQHLYQKHICSLDDASITKFQFGQTPKRLPLFKQMQGLELTEEDIQMNTLDIDSLESYSCPTSQTNAALSQMMMLMLNNENNNHLSQQSSSSSCQNSPFYLMSYGSNESSIIQNNIPTLSNFHTLSNQQSGNFFIPQNASLFSSSNTAKQCSQDKDLSMISNANTADTSESISNFSLNDKYNSIPSAEKLVSTNLFA